MHEVIKTKAIWSKSELSILTGKGIDIGYGGDIVSPDALGFDLKNGDANYITKYIKEEFDYVFSSHCLEHMIDPYNALFEWWHLVKPGGFLFFIVPDEDLYEQGIWPSRFNSDHKWTFTISKDKSWSPKSVNLLDVALDYHKFKGGELISLKLQDQGYNRSVKDVDQTFFNNTLAQIQCIIKKRKE